MKEMMMRTMLLGMKYLKVASIVLLLTFTTTHFSWAQENHNGDDILDLLPGILAASKLSIDNDGDGYTENQGDCNDTVAAINPGATEISGDGIDQDCSGDDAVVVPPPVPTSSPEGLYTGRTSTGRLASGLILDDNTFYILYSTIGADDEIAGLVQGNLILGDNTYTSTNAKDFNLEGLGVLPATVEGSYVEKQSTSGSVYYPTLLETTSYNTVYDAAYELTPSIATIAGSYSGEVVTSEGWETAALTISPTGILSGSGSSGCSVSGSVLPSTTGATCVKLKTLYRQFLLKNIHSLCLCFRAGTFNS